jgi:hypothetical protein
MKLIDELLATLPDGPVRDVRIGAFWTAVVEAVLWAVSQGANFQQIHQHGVRLVTMQNKE